MNAMRRFFLRFLLVPLALALSPAAVQAQGGPPDELIKLADDTYAFVGSFYVSLFIVTSDGVIATDPGSQRGPERALAYKAAIASVTDQPVRYLVYSHDHADHATGGDVFADTATFVAHRLAAPKIAALADPRVPVPTVLVDDMMKLELGGKTIELRYMGRNHSDNSLVVFYPERRIAFAVDFIPIHSMPFRNLPDFYPEEWIASLRAIEENLDFDTLVAGHPPATGTKADVAAVREYVEALIAAVRDAQAQRLADNSPEMIAAVRAKLEPAYGGLANFNEWLPLNIEGIITASAMPR